MTLSWSAELCRALELRPRTPRKEHLTLDQGRIDIAELLRGSNDGKLCKGDLRRVAQQMGCVWKTVSRLWKKYVGQRAAGVGDPDITSNRKNCGRQVIDLEDLREAPEDITITKRTTRCSLAARAGHPAVDPVPQPGDDNKSSPDG